MRILALVTNAAVGVGGLERYNVDFLKALSSCGPKVEVVTKSRHEKFNKWHYLFSVLKTFVTNSPFDLIFCGHLHLSPLAAVLGRLSGIPVWLQLHGIEAWKKTNSVWDWAARQATLVTAVSRYTRRRFLAWSRIAPERVKVLPNTVDEKFQPGPKPDYLLGRYDLAGKKVLLTVSRLSSKEKYKGHDKVLRIIPRLLQKHSNLVYIIAGEGDDRERLEAIAKEEGLNGSVRFIGNVDESELVDHYRIADLFVMPSSGEGFGIVFLEAAACGIPVISGDGDGSVDTLAEGKFGCSVNVDNLEELYTAIEGLLDHKKEDLGQPLMFSQNNFCDFVKMLSEFIT